MKKLFYQQCLVTLGLLWLAVGCSAQVNPGYLGRKLFVEVGTILQPSVHADATNKLKGVYQAPFPLAIGWNAAINYTIGRAVVFKAGWSHLNFDVGSSHQLNNQDNYIDREYHDAIYRVYAHDIHFGFDFYLTKRRGNLAPLGTYIGLGTKFLGTHRQLLAGTEGIKEYIIPTSQYPFIRVGLYAALGYRAVIGERFLIAVALSSCIFPQNYQRRDFVTYHRGEERDYNNYLDVVEYAVSTRYGLSLQLGLGVFLTR